MTSLKSNLQRAAPINGIRKSSTLLLGKSGANCFERRDLVISQPDALCVMGLCHLTILYF